MTFTLFSVAILMVFAVIAGLEIYQGMKKGFFKAMVAFGMALLCMVISLILAPLLSDLIATTVLAQYSSVEICNMLRVRYEIAGDLILPIISLLSSIVLFVVLFLVLMLLRALLAFAALDNEEYELAPKIDEGTCSNKRMLWLVQKRRALGGIVGALSAVLIAMVITSPLMGALDVANQLIDTANDFDDRIWDRVAMDTTELESVQTYAADIPGNVFYQLGGKHMFATVATTQYKGEEVHLLDEIAVLKRTLKNLNVLLNCIGPNTVASEEDIANIYQLCEDIDDMKLLELLVADFVSQSAKGWLDNKLVMGLEKPQVHPAFSKLWDQTLNICAKTSVSQSKKNTITLLRIYAILLESGLTRTDINELALAQNIRQYDVINRVQVELVANKNTAKLENEFKRAVLKTQIDYMFTYKFHSSVEDKTRYTKLTQNIAEVLSNIQNRGYINQERLISATSNAVKPYLNEYGLNFSDSMLTILSEAIADKLIYAYDEITADDVKEFLENYR